MWTAKDRSVERNRYQRVKQVFLEAVEHTGKARDEPSNASRRGDGERPNTTQLAAADVAFTSRVKPRSGTVRMTIINSTPKRLLLAVLCCLTSAAAWAQDAHYWTRQYGPTETLLGGLVVGSAYDLSATFYNPGALALAVDPRFTFSLDALEIWQIRIPDGAGEDLDFRSRGLEFAPSFVSGQIGSGETNRYAFAFLTRQDLTLRFSARRDANNDGGAASTAGVRVDQTAREYWAGGTWSRRVRKTLGFGVSQFFALRGQRTFTQLTAGVAAPDNPGSSILQSDEFRYSHLRVLWKLGLSYRPSDALSLGASLTTPGVGLFGDGKVDVQRSITGVDLDGDGSPDSAIASRLQRNIGTSYKSPMSVAFGLRYRFADTAIHVSGEWFDSVDPYTVIEAEPVVIRPTGGAFDPSVNHSARAIVNFGVGVEQRLSSKMTVYGSWMRDASSAVSDPELNHAFATWDFSHLTAGVRVGEGTRSWTFGFGYAFGDDELVRLVDLSESDGRPPVGDPPDSVSVFSSRWKIIFGFNLGTE